MSLKTYKLWGICNIDIETERQKTERQKENETKDDELDSEDIQAISNDLLRFFFLSFDPPKMYHLEISNFCQELEHGTASAIALSNALSSVAFSGDEIG